MGNTAVTDLSGKELASTVLKNLSQIGIDVSKMRGQGNDGAAAMSGRLNGAQVHIVAAASLFIASRGGASPQTFEKRALTIFRLEPDPYESAHQLDCSFFFLQQWPMEPKGTTISCYQIQQTTNINGD